MDGRGGEWDERLEVMSWGDGIGWSFERACWSFGFWFLVFLIRGVEMKESWRWDGVGMDCWVLSLSDEGD